MVTNEAGVGEGQGNLITDDVEKLLGRKPKHIEDLMPQYAYMWEENIRHWLQVR